MIFLYKPLMVLGVKVGVGMASNPRTGFLVLLLEKLYVKDTY